MPGQKTDQAQGQDRYSQGQGALGTYFRGVKGITAKTFRQPGQKVVALPIERGQQVGGYPAVSGIGVEELQEHTGSGCQ